MVSFDKHVKIRQEKQGAVVFDTLREKVFVTNETGGEILQLMQEGLSTEEITAALAEIYEQDPGAIRAEVEELIQALRTDGLLKPEEGTK